MTKRWASQYHETTTCTTNTSAEKIVVAKTSQNKLKSNQKHTTETSTQFGKILLLGKQQNNHTKKPFSFRPRIWHSPLWRGKTTAWKYNTFKLQQRNDALTSFRHNPCNNRKLQTHSQVTKGHTKKCHEILFQATANAPNQTPLGWIVICVKWVLNKRELQGQLQALLIFFFSFDYLRRCACL